VVICAAAARQEKECPRARMDKSGFIGGEYRAR
jgi:hypothetical protein